MTYWQIASGDGNVELEDIFLRLNVALIGPGHLGDYWDHRNEYLQLPNGHLVRTFCEDVNEGDFFVLKRVVDPRAHEWEIRAVGRVVGAYRYEPIFENVDVDAWQMQHCRRVAWQRPEARTTVIGGGAPIRIQRLDDDNPLRIKAADLVN